MTEVVAVADAVGDVDGVAVGDSLSLVPADGLLESEDVAVIEGVCVGDGDAVLDCVTDGDAVRDCVTDGVP